jgi:hypothetical protein
MVTSRIGGNAVRLIVLGLAVLPFVVTGLTHAQTAETHPYKFDCSTLSYVSAGCASFNEMVAKMDKDILSTLNGNEAFVCFRPDEDVFFVISFQVPDDSEYSPITLGSREAAGVIGYDRFKDGVSEDTDIVFGKWKKLRSTAATPYFASDPKSQSYAAINDTEVSYHASFQNLQNTKTAYDFQIRRSTLRFSETYTFPAERDPKKPASAPTSDRAEYTGYCTEFKQ